MTLPPWWRRAVTGALVAAAAWYLWRAVAGNWEQMRRFPWDVDPLLLGMSVAAHVGVLAWGVWVWGRVLAHFDHPRVEVGALQRIWWMSNLARYIPGKVFQFLAVAQLARGAGLSGAVLVTSILVHTGITLLGAIVVSAWTLSAELFPALPAGLLGIAAVAGCAVAVHPAVLGWALGLLARVTKRDVLRWRGRWGDGLLLLGLGVAMWMAYGVAYWLFLASLAPVPARLLPALSGVNALSFVGGYLAFFSPGGLGVREVVMKNLLEPFVPGGVAAVLSVASRLWTIAAELTGGALVVLLFRRSAPQDLPAGEPTPE